MTPSELIKDLEGLKLKSYRDSGGIWTIGYGSTGPDINEGIVWTKEDCEKRLALDLMVREKQLKHVIQIPLTENQKAAIMSFLYNIGFDAFKKSTFLKKLNNCDVAGAADQMLRWNKCNGEIVEGLNNRRARERAVFLEINT